MQALCWGGIVQNKTIRSSEESKQINAAYLDENTGYVGAGEWLPQGLNTDVAGLTAAKTVKADGETTNQELRHEGKYYYFTTEKGAKIYTLPLMFYKGYEGWLYAKDGSSARLMLDKSDNSLVRVHNTKGKEGEIRIEYAGTVLQKISTLISLITALGILAYLFRKYIKGRL